MNIRYLSYFAIPAAVLLTWQAPVAAKSPTKSATTPAAAPLATSAETSDSDDAGDLLLLAEQRYHQGDWQQALRDYEKAYQAADATSPIRAEAALGWSSLLWEQGDYSLASKRIDEAIDLASKLHLDQAIGRLLLTKGHIETSRGNLQDAENTLAICVKSARDQNDEVFASLCAINQRLVRQLRGRPAGAQSDYQQAIARLKAAESPLAIGTSLARTAELHEKSGNAELALELLRAAQVEFERAKSTPAQLRNQLRIARVLQEQQRYPEARTYLAGKVTQLQAMNNRPVLIDALVLSAQDARAQGQLTEAGRLYARVLQVAKQTGSPTLIARAHLTLCEFGLQQPPSATASQDTGAHCESAATQFDRLQLQALSAQSQAALAQFYQTQGMLNQASSAYSRAIQSIEKLPASPLTDARALGRMRANLCQVELTLRAKGTYYLCQRALEELSALSPAPTDMLAATHYAIGVSAGRDGRLSTATSAFEKASQLAHALNPPDIHMAADSQLRRGIIFHTMMKNKRDDATQAFTHGLALIGNASTQPPDIAELNVQLRTQLAQLHLEYADWTAARETLQPLLSADSASPGERAWAYSALAKAELKLGNRDAARKALRDGLPLSRLSGDQALVKSFEENLAKLEK